MGRMLKKGERGLAAQYITRNRAVRKLQISLKDFRRLCILKGIYPREPRNRRKAQRGSTELKTLYYKKDIRFLMHEPIIWKFREMKIFMRRLTRAVGKKDSEKAERVRMNKPIYKLDHIIQERYPTFIDALHDLDDPLSMAFLYATLPKSTKLPMDMIQMCKRLTIEFMHYVIEARALRKVFISIKGYYYQVEIQGQTITWVVPHPLGHDWRGVDVDFRIMTTFTEFYVTLLGFINFRLYHKLNLHYPPRLPGIPEKKEDDDHTQLSDLIVALNISLEKAFQADAGEEEDMQIDTHLLGENDQRIEAARLEAERLKRLKSLFEGMKVFLSRETNRESLVFIIRACGGVVSWDKSVWEGATFNETDETITHQVVDRPTVDKTYLSRYYVQPQWVYDCINARLLLPVQDYFPGVELPPHLSPFAEEGELEYVPPEKKKILAMERGEYKKSAEEEEEEEEEEDEDESEEGDEEEAMEEEEEDQESEAKKKVGSVQRGQVDLPDKVAEKKVADKEEIKMRAMMIPKKQRRLYQKLKKRERRKTRTMVILANKRRRHDERIKEEKKAEKKAEADRLFTPQPARKKAG
ncbi:pescadillo homolog [Oratosquilla oratoria]|uniref:pescadillo homolog n=1 Tax=Oratosquilla oratoria TaxID=337810 RepID=UPI003F7717C4